MNNVPRLEALFDSLVAVSGYRDPQSKQYQLRNPISLRVFINGEATNELRKFDSLCGGIQAALFDLKIKCSGKSRAKLLADQFTIQGLVRSYFMPDLTADKVAQFLRRALNDEYIKPSTRLDYFLES